MFWMRMCNCRKLTCNLGDRLHGQDYRRYSKTSSAARGGPQPAIRAFRRTPNVFAGRTTVMA